MSHSVRDLIRTWARRSRGLEILKIPNLGTFLDHRRCDLVIDVGANVGQFGEGLRKLDYRGRILSFEPVDDCFRHLAARAARDGAWDVRNVALGAHPHQTEINVSSQPVFSSIRELSAVGTQFGEAAQVVRKQVVQVSTLDIEIQDVATERPFLKIDTQGFEKEVLRGAEETLKKCVGVQLELPVDNLYVDVWSFSESICFMEKLGFTPAQMLPVGQRWALKDPVSAVEFDCVFRRIE